MTLNETRRTGVPQLVWVYTDSLQAALDAATWLETTQELRRLGWQVKLVVPGPREVQAIHGVSVVSIPKPNVYLLRQVIFHLSVLAFLLREWSRLDVILFHQMSAPWLLPLRWLRAVTRRRAPLLIMDTRTVPMIPTHLATTRDRVRNAFDHLMNRAANRLADGQTAITLRMAQVVGVPREKLLGVWPSGVNPVRFAQARAQRCWPKADEPVQLIYVGAVQLERHLVQLAEAVEAANAAGMAFRFMVVGSGSAQEELAEMAQRSNGRIIMIPPVPHADVPAFLAQAHVGVLPFPDEERFRVSSPIKLFEYMAAGLAVLATRIVCHTDVVEQTVERPYTFWAADAGVDGLLAALKEIWQRRADLPAMGQSAAAASDGWTWPASAQKLSRALERGLQQVDRTYVLETGSVSDGSLQGVD